MIRMTSTLVDLDEYYLINKGRYIPCWLKKIKTNRDLYNLYKEEMEKDESVRTLVLDEEESKQINFLSVLDRLGYPMDEVGTHLYKDSIVAAYDELLDIYQNEEFDKTEIVEKDLKNIYSNLYHMIARDEYELGSNIFHSYISKAVGMRNYDNIDDTLRDAIFGVDYVEEDHRVQAFRIASYFAKKDSIKMEKQYVKAK